MARVRLRGRRTLELTLPNARVMAAEARSLTDRIVARTRSGRDEQNRKFRPYTYRYALRKGVSPGAVDLTLTGDMLDNLSPIKVARNGFTIGFLSRFAALKAAWNETKYPQRRFMGIPPTWLNDLVRRLRKEIRLTSGR